MSRTEEVQREKYERNRSAWDRLLFESSSEEKLRQPKRRFRLYTLVEQLLIQIGSILVALILSKQLDDSTEDYTQDESSRIRVWLLVLVIITAIGGFVLFLLGQLADFLEAKFHREVTLSEQEQPVLRATKYTA